MKKDLSYTINGEFENKIYLRKSSPYLRKKSHVNPKKVLYSGCEGLNDTSDPLKCPSSKV